MAQSDLSIVQSVDPTPAVLGEAMTISAEVVNAGPEPASDVTVTILIPDAAAVLSFTDGGVQNGSTSVTWELPSLPVSEAQSFSLTVLATATPASVETQLIVAARDNLGGPGLYTMDVAAGLATILTGLDAMDPGGVSRGTGPAYVVDGGDPELFIDETANADGVIFDDLGQVVASGRRLVNPADLVVRDDQLLLVADRNGFRGGKGAAGDTSGRILLVDPGSTGAQVVFSEGNHLTTPAALALSNDGQLLVADANGNLVQIDEAGEQTLLTSGGQISDPTGLAVDGSGLIYLSDAGNGLVAIDPDGFEQTVVAAVDSVPGFSEPAGVAASVTGNVFVSSLGGAGRVLGFDPLLPGFFAVLEGESLGFQSPGGMVKTDLLRTEAMVMFAGDDPDTSDNSFVLATELTGIGGMTGGVAVIEITEGIGVSDTVAVTPARQINVSESVGIADAGAATDLVAPATFISIRESLSLRAAPSATPPDDPPPTIKQLRPLENSCEGEQGVITDTPLTRIALDFDQAMLLGEQDPGGVNNPQNYRLAPTEGCDGTPALTFAGASYDDDRRTLGLALASPLPAGDYAFRACDRIEASTLVRLDGDGDGEAGTDYLKRFQLIGDSVLANPNFDDAIAPWQSEATRVSDDSANLRASGSLALAGGQAVSQCAPLNPGTEFLRQSMAVKSGGASRIQLTLDYFADAECQQTLASLPVTVSTPEGGGWNRIFADFAATDGAVSVLLSITPDGPLNIDAVALYAVEQTFRSGYEGGECGSLFAPIERLD